MDLENPLQRVGGGIIVTTRTLAIVRHICAQNDSLVRHLVEAGGGAQVLWHGPGVADQDVPSYLHQDVEDLDVLLDGGVVLDDETGALRVRGTDVRSFQGSQCAVS